MPHWPAPSPRRRRVRANRPPCRWRELSGSRVGGFFGARGTSACRGRRLSGMQLVSQAQWQASSGARAGGRRTSPRARAHRPSLRHGCATWTPACRCAFRAGRRSLLDAELASQVDLRAIERAARVAQGHLLRDQFSGAGVDFGASLARQLCQLVLEASRYCPARSRATDPSMH
jgi:hypothetical protein